MKPRIILSAMMAVMLVLATGCYKDILDPGQDPSAPPQAVSFSGDLIPIFTTHCSTSGCHDAVPAHKPALTPDKAYNAIIGGGYVNLVVPASSILYGEIKSGSMPPSGALKTSDMQKVLDWIRNGAPNN